ncbi:hypothetical protein G6011_00296 [Alternaria panax]|uniref:Uncharacterized protein n=1 Tax=Alternaria panax TaxID=48097 RepID=A0AAD4IHW7_9PLEO|nr:hypothetical protein G6011_00296 [Alternaria panax]
MYPRKSKDGHDPSRPPRAPSTTKTQHEEDKDGSSQSGGEEKTEDGHEDHSISASSSPSTRHQSDWGARAPPFQYRHRSRNLPEISPTRGLFIIRPNHCSPSAITSAAVYRSTRSTNTASQHISGSGRRPPQSYPISGEYGSSSPAMDRFRREAARLAFEQQNGRQQRAPSLNFPQPVRRHRALHPAHNHPSGQSSTSQPPGQQSTQSPQDPNRPTRGPSRRQPGDDKDQNEGTGA